MDELVDFVTGISIHALREEGDVRVSHRFQVQPEFLSTPSARRATCAQSVRTSATIFLSTPSARRATPSLSEVSR